MRSILTSDLISSLQDLLRVKRLLKLQRKLASIVKNRRSMKRQYEEASYLHGGRSTLIPKLTYEILSTLRT